jgi:hypothetical protein
MGREKCGTDLEHLQVHWECCFGVLARSIYTKRRLYVQDNNNGLVIVMTWKVRAGKTYEAPPKRDGKDRFLAYPIEPPMRQREPTAKAGYSDLF